MAASEERRLQALVLAPVRRVRRRLNAEVWLERGVAPAWAVATACVLVRMGFPRAPGWAVLPLAAVGLWAWVVRARSQSVSLEHAAVLADRSAGASGLLLTRLERSVGEWELAANQLARAVKLPPIRWRRPVAALLGAVLFAGVGHLLPRPVAKETRINAAAATQVAAVQAQAEALAREEPLGANVEEELRRLSEEVSEGRFDAADWEATDALSQRLAERAAEAAAQLARAAEAARELEDALGPAGNAEAVTREREALEQALMELDRNAQGQGDSKNGAQSGTEQAAEASNAGAQGSEQGASGTQQGAEASNSGARGSEQGANSGAQGAEQQEGRPSESGEAGSHSAQARAKAAGNPTQISDLRRALAQRQASLERQFGNSPSERPEGASSEAQREARAASGQGSRSQSSSSANGSPQQGAGHSQNGQGRPITDGDHLSRHVRSGNGGASSEDGTGETPLAFGGSAEMDPRRLAFEPLPAGHGGEAGEVWGLRSGDARPREGAAAAGGSRGTGARGEATAGPGATPLLPRNRELVKRYFGGE
ncbi:hypothetical protein JGU66_04410 [Myxococcaceae bacterium JPH2]|nr:hypothetical protein [Myxococcaceae bacterium JPH2]